jgi:hypothetical protein
LRTTKNVAQGRREDSTPRLKTKPRGVGGGATAADAEAEE